MADPDPAIARALDMSATSVQNMTIMMQGMTLQNRFNNLPLYDGQGISLRDFLQDVQNLAVSIPAGDESDYVAIVISKLRGAIRNCLHGSRIDTIAELVKILKKRHTTGRTYNYYNSKLSSMRMSKDESVGDFYDRFRTVIACGRNAYRTEYGAEPPAEDKDPLYGIGRGTFIRGLPSQMSAGVLAQKPKTLDEACELAEYLSVNLPSSRQEERTETLTFYSRDGARRE